MSDIMQLRKLMRPLTADAAILESLILRTGMGLQTIALRGLVLLGLTCSGIPAVAASFDCGKASTPQEKSICSDARLSKLDDDVAAAYKSLRAQLAPAAAPAMCSRISARG